MCNLYNTLSQLCEERRITGYRMCKDCGISPGAMTDLKAGRKKILSAVNMQKLADYFGVTIDYLLCSETKKSSPGTDDSAEAALDEELIRRLALLTPEEAAKVDAFVQGILAAR